MPKDKLYETVVLVAGGVSLAIFGLLGVLSLLRVGPDPTYLVSGVLSVALTGGVLLLLRASHPPAGAPMLTVKERQKTMTDGESEKESMVEPISRVNTAHLLIRHPFV